MKINKKYEESIYDNVLPTTTTSSIIYKGNEDWGDVALENLASFISHSLSTSGFDFKETTN